MCYTLQLSACLFCGGIRRKGEKNYHESHILQKSLRIFSEMVCIMYQKTLTLKWPIFEEEMQHVMQMTLESVCILKSEMGLLQAACRSYVFPHSATLCLLMGKFNQCTFRVIIDSKDLVMPSYSLPSGPFAFPLFPAPPPPRSRSVYAYFCNWLYPMEVCSVSLCLLRIHSRSLLGGYLVNYNKTSYR